MDKIRRECAGINSSERKYPKTTLNSKHFPDSTSELAAYELPRVMIAFLDNGPIRIFSDRKALIIKLPIKKLKLLWFPSELFFCEIERPVRKARKEPSFQ